MGRWETNAQHTSVLTNTPSPVALHARALWNLRSGPGEERTEARESGVGRPRLSPGHLSHDSRPFRGAWVPPGIPHPQSQDYLPLLSPHLGHLPPSTSCRLTPLFPAFSFSASLCLPLCPPFSFCDSVLNNSFPSSIVLFLCDSLQPPLPVSVLSISLASCLHSSLLFFSLPFPRCVDDWPALWTSPSLQLPWFSLWVLLSLSLPFLFSPWAQINFSP